MAKLREWFNDPLFVKSPQGLQPTIFIKNIENDLAEWSLISTKLSQKNQGVNSAKFKFAMSMESPLYLLAATQLPDLVLNQFPNSKAKITQWDYDSIESIINGDINIGFCGRETNASSPESPQLLPYVIDYEILLEDKPVVYLHTNHPALTLKWDLDSFLSYQHIGILWENAVNAL
ncbi:hypothetical protein JQC92_19060 [Shewanella sp. 202IG2-18]|uniref:hypothetical protein n=1 Tax=Parashewanella hymeniacidonis TaxID=2807618 RepID=UPI0019613924|nr:hypothetical protein [Parashewanella hymeniacidonis]MBM7074107.1 hypothetical protein [Parashewanella hymeniacidonis]